MERVVAHYKPVIDKLAGKLPENQVINYPAAPINRDFRFAPTSEWGIENRIIDKPEIHCGKIIVSTDRR